MSVWEKQIGDYTSRVQMPEPDAFGEVRTTKEVIEQLLSMAGYHPAPAPGGDHG